MFAEVPTVLQEGDCDLLANVLSAVRRSIRRLGKEKRNRPGR